MGGTSVRTGRVRWDRGRAWQPSLLDCGQDAGLGELSPRRTVLAHGAWVDFRSGWVTGADALFERLAAVVPWRAERRRMYDRTVAVPRLLKFYGEDEPLPDPVLDEAREALSAHYAAELGEPFRTAGLCLYRDGGDSVAWHGDRKGRGAGRTRWSRSCRSAPRVPCSCARRAVARRCVTTSGTATCWSWAAVASARGSTRCPRPRGPRAQDQHPVPPARRPLTGRGLKVRSPDADS